MKFSVSSYSYSKNISSGKMTLTDCIKFSAEAGFDGFEFVDFTPPESLTKKEYAAILREECEKRGITPVAYTIGADFLYGSDGCIEKEIERLCEEVETAAVLGVKLMRHDAARGYKKEDRKYRGFDDALPAIVKGCREVTNYAKKYSIRTMIENHGTFCQESVRVEKIVNKVADDNFGLLIDIGNFLCADENPEEAVGRLAPYAFHIHAKDFHKKSGNAPLFCDGFFKTRGGNYLRGAVIGHGDVPVYQCLSALAENGYNGFVTVEFEGIETPETGVVYGLNTLKRMYATIE